MYSVKEIFYTLQGEGANAGTPAVFLRFTGCNLWSGREQDRATAICRFCDTDFVGTDGTGGGAFRNVESLADAVTAKWPPNAWTRRFVVCTGGEPLLQLDAPLIESLHDRGFRIAIETNGTIAAPAGVDWTCVSPKASATLIQTRGDELKLVYPQPGAEPERFVDLEFDHFFLQPMDGALRVENTRLAADYCMRHPGWRLSLQVHKLIGIP
ncbi:MAG TPA: 7-carboxy-7-deazaguanine synthase [Burkholderiales bacterium]|nr:7-carboxy-7-deazaguanine synthase [Burkholderiales bacterium]HXV11446.1 7-carboxy-7-deazaguanine synthase [Burkholderiales bacterium]